MFNEIPVRYFGLSNINNIFDIGLSGYLIKVWYKLTHIDLRIYACEVISSVVILTSLASLGIKKAKSKFEKELFYIIVIYMLLLSIHPNKFIPYLYVIMPYFAICIALYGNKALFNTAQNDMQVRIKKNFAGLLVTMFIVSGIAFSFKSVSSNKITNYDKFIKKVVQYIPENTTVVGPKYYWPGMYKKYHFISSEQFIYEVEKVMTDTHKKDTLFQSLSLEERKRIVKKAFKNIGAEYVLYTWHSWSKISAFPRYVEGSDDVIRKYVFYHSDKLVDFLKIKYYPNRKEANKYEDEVYLSPRGFDNVGAEYQHSLKIYKLKDL
ncbi:MAG: hypothetical protein HQK84_12250 [Nitrospinae bacterium]|nr:hypothetical protein [Nitrospinota bacterium]